MKVMFFFLITLGLATAQEQQGSVAIAGAIVPSSIKLMEDFTKCVERLAKITPLQAIKACEAVTKVTAKLAAKVANEAADATKSSRPQVIWGGGGYGGYGSYGGARFEGYNNPSR